MAPGIAKSIAGTLLTIMRRPATFLALLAALIVSNPLPLWLRAQGDGELRAVIVVARHGVRAPIEGELHGNEYNVQPWPKWSTPAAFLTPHGADALKSLGDFYRQQYRGFLGEGCEHLYVRANQVQRTIASAHAVLAGLVSGCHVPVTTLANDDAPLLMRDPDRTQADPVFEVEAFADRIDRDVWAAAVRGQMGDDPARWAAERRTALAEIARVMAACPAGCADGAARSRRSLLLDPSSVSAGKGPSISIASPVSTAGDFAQVFYLQYLEGLPMRDVAWGQLSADKVQELMGTSVEFRDRTLRTPYSAEAGASELAARLDATLRQAAGGQAVEGAFGSPSQRFVLLMGHDGNLTRLGGLLRLQWLLPEGALNSTPPGSALVFELRRSADRYMVRVRFQSQTADQIRTASPLNAEHPPATAPVFVPGCSTSAPGFPCDLDRLRDVIQRAVNPSFALRGPRR
jgi:4-phytase / acid phosphatase